MYITSRRPFVRRRGVVLILILAMLGLLAVIGVTFATFSGQAQIGQRYYSEGQKRLDPERIFDFGLEQLINDTDNPASAIRGHSLKRDMYGNDAYTNGALAVLPDGSPLVIAAVSQLPNGTMQVQTNIPFMPPGVPQLANLNFSTWALRITSQTINGVTYPAQTLEVLPGGDTVGNSACHLLTVTAPDSSVVQMQPVVGAQFTLDGRFMRAFNGSGLTAAGYGQLPNFLFNGISPDTYAMDEDYDACDLENWFMALQSADGSVIIPSFHRPGVIRYDTTAGIDDWSQWGTPSTNYATVSSNSTALALFTNTRARFLRPRAVDNPSAGQKTFPDLRPDMSGTPATNPNFGKVTFDVDNDGDGTPDSVWVDLGFPAQRSADGKLYKPLFAFMVLGLNGKLPLNTAGNLNRRDYNPVAYTDPNTGLAGSTLFPQPAADHASHLGYSPSEINPKYAFCSATSMTTIGTAGPSFGTFQNQKVLQGSLDTNNSPIQGRWGEAELLLSAGTTGLFPRAGITRPLGGSNDNYTALDFYPPETANPPVAPNFPEYSDYTDLSGSLLLPSERIRRFVTPIDLTGNGKVIAWNDDPTNISGLKPILNPSLPLQISYNPTGTEFGFGFDNRGRSGFLLYFRPPRLPPGIFIPPGTGATQPNPIEFNLQNLTHGYESYRNPLGKPGNVTAGLPPDPAARQYWGAMPWNYNNAANATVTTLVHPQVLPTFVGDINAGKVWPGNGLSAPTPPYIGGYGIYPGTTAYPPVGLGSLVRDTADEMNLYTPSVNDAPFTVSDLEWLYRYQDIDGSSLQSRLSSLVPETFVPNSLGTNSPSPAEARGRRLLFTTDTWDLNNYAWANDYPGATALFANNHRFVPAASASTLGLGISAPSIAQRGRRINLNFPLPTDPVSANNPIEPVRQKWIRETYTFLKNVLPPKAVDSAEELAQLSQYVVNIVDFRDPDGTITKFVNTDVMVVGQSSTNQSPAIVLATTQPAIPYNPALTEASGYLVQYGMEYPPVAIHEALAYSYPNINGNIADPYQTKGAKNLNRFFLELVNTLTKDAGIDGMGGQPTRPTGCNMPSWMTAADLTLAGWDIAVIGEDGVNDGLARPNPYTGQITWSMTPPATFKFAPLAKPGAMTLPDGVTKADAMVGTDDTTVMPILALSNGGGFKNRGPTGSPPKPGTFFVVGYNDTLALTSEQDASGQPMVQPDAVLRSPTSPITQGAVTDLFPNAPTPPTAITGSGVATPNPYVQYYWVYLRRPLYPMMAYQPNSTLPNYNPMVVVDSMRFPFFKSDAIWDKANNIVSNSPAAPAQRMWSVQRPQPYRGGQGVSNYAVGVMLPSWPLPPSTTSTSITLQPVAFGGPAETSAALPPTYDPAWAAYGYSEQMWYSDDDTGIKCYYGPPATYPNYVTLPIHHTISAINKLSSSTDESKEAWDGLVFHDRDFQSVAELLLVPGCPPGLFTKQFVEAALTNNPNPFVLPPQTDSTGTGQFPNIACPTIFPLGSQEGNLLLQSLPHVYPYLVDKFYYSATGQTLTDYNVNLAATPPLYSLVPSYDANPVPNNVPIVGNSTGDGWHKMLEFFEVPSSVNGAVGPVMSGENRDWMRQDQRPGQINLNLIIDEEVFFGLIDDPRLWSQLGTPTLPVAFTVPQVVTQVDSLGNPTVDPSSGLLTGAYSMNNRGTYRMVDSTTAPPTTTTLMSPAFANFLKLRHGNPNAIYTAAAGTLPINTGVVSNFMFGSLPEAPFHSLSYPDIRYTVMRPADPQCRPPLWRIPYVNPSGTPAYLAPANAWIGREVDSGLRPAMNPGAHMLALPTVAPLRLFQIPDGSQMLGTNVNASVPNPNSLSILPLLSPGVPPTGSIKLTFPPPAASVQVPVASTYASPYPALAQWTDPAVAPPMDLITGNVIVDAAGNSLNGTARPTLVMPMWPLPGGVDALGNTIYAATPGMPENVNFPPYAAPGNKPLLFLGGGNATSDNREHPYFRTEWLQKIMNLTTVRTHQYAVWVTVGLFEVTKQGNPQLAATNPLLAVDQLGPELNASKGQAVRYRAFFVIDRSRATGFNPQNPGDFRDLIVYRRRIE